MHLPQDDCVKNTLYVVHTLHNVVELYCNIRTPRGLLVVYRMLQLDSSFVVMLIWVSENEKGTAQPASVRPRISSMISLLRCFKFSNCMLTCPRNMSSPAELCDKKLAHLVRKPGNCRLLLMQSICGHLTLLSASRKFAKILPFTISCQQRIWHILKLNNESCGSLKHLYHTDRQRFHKVSILCLAWLLAHA